MAKDGWSSDIQSRNLQVSMIAEILLTMVSEKLFKMNWKNGSPLENPSKRLNFGKYPSLPEKRSLKKCVAALLPAGATLRPKKPWKYRAAHMYHGTITNEWLMRRTRKMSCVCIMSRVTTGDSGLSACLSWRK